MKTKKEPKQKTEQINVGGGSGSLPMYDVKELNEIIKLFNDKEIDLYTCIGRVWNKAYFIGAKEMAKRMYSEEEVYDLLVEWTAYQNGFPRVDEDEIPNGFMSFNQWFEQFSKLKNG
jgi:hypothetical protein